VDRASPAAAGRLPARAISTADLFPVTLRCERKRASKGDGPDGRGRHRSRVGFASHLRMTENKMLPLRGRK